METLEYQLQKFQVGVVVLDNDNRVLAMNQEAMRALIPYRGDAIGRDILSMHPEKSREKVGWVLEQVRSAEAADGVSPPMTMMINIPDRVLLIRVSRLNAGDDTFGTCMLFYDLTEVATTGNAAGEADGARNGAKNGARAANAMKTLCKLPVFSKNRIVLVDLNDVIRFQADGHYTCVVTAQDTHLCNLSLADIEPRLAADQFLRVHRSHIVNIRAISAIERKGEGMSLRMSNDVAADAATEIPVSRSHVGDIKAMLGLA